MSRHNYLEAWLEIKYGDDHIIRILETKPNEIDTIKEAQDWATLASKALSNTAYRFGEIILAARRVYVGPEGTTYGSTQKLDWSREDNG